MRAPAVGGRGLGCGVLAFAALTLATPAGATTIWLYRETAAVAAAVSLTGTAGDTYASTQTAFGALLGDSALSMLQADADLSSYDIPDGYLDLALGSGSAIREADGLVEVNAATGYGECNPLACGAGFAGAFIDITFRPDANAGFEAHYYPVGGTVSAFLMDLSADTVVHEASAAGYDQRFGVELLDGHLYRWIASGVSLSPPAGDPYADFSFRFYDTLTGAGADFAAVPEPSALVMFGTGVAAWILRRRATRRRP